MLEVKFSKSVTLVEQRARHPRAGAVSGAIDENNNKKPYVSDSTSSASFALARDRAGMSRAREE